MPFCFDENKVIHVILFMLQCMGGKVHVQRLYTLLYLSDVIHLVKHGALVTGDVYVAMKAGPVPLNTLGLYRRLRVGALVKIVAARVKPLVSIEEQDVIVAHSHCDVAVLAETEVACLFHVVHSHKDETTERLLTRVKGVAWEQADSNCEISLVQMAMENGATPEMIRYIEMSFNDEVNSFR